MYEPSKDASVLTVETPEKKEVDDSSSKPEAKVVKVKPSGKKVETSDAVEVMLKRFEKMEADMAAREARLAEKEKQLDDKINQAQKVFLQPMSPEVQQQTEANHHSKAEIMKAHLEKQPKVNTYLPLAIGEKPGATVYVCMNGYRMNVPKGVYIDLPKQVADLLRVSFEQTNKAGEAFRLDNPNASQAKIEALS